jgi:protein-S-isoprenylcysteine O-methyltransferase Ste14
MPTTFTAWSSHVVLGLSVDSVPLAAAGTTPYWQIWVLLGVVAVCFLPILVQVLTHPDLLRRRLRFGPLAEREPKQRLIISLFLLCYFALLAVTVLDHKRGWSQVPVPVVLLGDVLIAAGLVLIWLVFRANSYAAASVTVEQGQSVSTTGPYAIVRHPMYSGLMLLLVGLPLALGSWWGLVLVPPILGVIIWRLLDEERYLSAHLSGYRAYTAKVTHRLMPYIW